jgi:ubiquinone/menaquinone biosynthesis C-methylase UbiE
MEDLYVGFAERYDLAYGSFEHADPQMTAFFLRLFAEDQVRRVLDCACGTGRHLVLLHHLGIDVTGSDVSPAMLARANKNLTSYRLVAPLQQADFRDLPQYFDKPSFDAVLCLAAIGYMPDEQELLRAFRSMRGVLRPGGVLILTSMPTDKQWREKTRFLLAANTQAVSRLFVVDYFERTARYNVLDVFHSENVNELQVWSAELSIFLKAEQDTLLKKAGFQRVDFYESFDFKPYKEESSNLLIAVART